MFSAQRNLPQENIDHVPDQDRGQGQDQGHGIVTIEGDALLQGHLRTQGHGGTQEKDDHCQETVNPTLVHHPDDTWIEGDMEKGTDRDLGLGQGQGHQEGDLGQLQSLQQDLGVLGQVLCQALAQDPVPDRSQRAGQGVVYFFVCS